MNLEEMRLLSEFSYWVFHIGNGIIPTIQFEDDKEELTWINIPDDLLLHCDDDSMRTPFSIMPIELS